jgi:hypothetical protein
MKQIVTIAVLCCSLIIFKSASAQQDKSKRASPPAKVTQTIQSGATISVDYSQPKLKGRTIGKDVEPMKGEVWRMGANEATIFETDRDVLIDGQKLPAGKYSLFGLWGDDGYTLLFNKVFDIWGNKHDTIKDQDVLKVVVKPGTATTSQDVLKYTIDKSGLVTLYWGTMTIGFNVE